MIHKLSTHWAKIELAAAAVFVLGVTVLILLNVVTRAFGIALFWVDELAIYAMIWMTLLTASAAVHYKSAVAVTIVTDTLSTHVATGVLKLVDLLVFTLALLIVWFCWRWFLPLDFMRAGFDVETFQGETFNFIYSEITNTLGIQKVWVWAVMWVFAGGLLLHSASNLMRPISSMENSQ